MKTISQAELNKLTASGAKVKRKMGTGKPAPKKVEEKKPEAPKEPVKMASMGASMQYLESQAQATLKILAKNTEVIEDFRQEVKTAVDKVGKKVPYVFDVERGEDRLIKRIVATPQKK